GSLWQDTLGLCYDLQAVKQRYRQQAPFRAGVGGVFRPSYADACFRYQDGQGDTGLLLGLRVNRMSDGWRFSLFPDEPIVAFRPFALNPDNYIYWQDARSIAADMRLSGENYASLWIHSEEEEGMEYDPVHVELSQIDLSLLSKSFAYLPSMGGMLNANLQYAPADSGFMVVADTHIDELFYERKRVGELFLNTVYLPLAEGEHQVDAHLFRDRQEISTLTALYQANGTEDSIHGSLAFLHLPLQMADPFIPDDMARMQGDLDGELTISGTASAPQTNGYLMLDSASVFVGALGSSFRFDGQRVPIRNNRLYFNQYKCYAYGENPLVLEGVVDLNDPSNLLADLKMNADELQVFQVKRNDESLVYGKMFVNLRSTLKGPLEALTMRGDLQILGTTDVTYVMQDSPVTVQDRLADMVTFVSFADSVRRKLPRKPPLPLGGLDLLMTVRVDPAVRCNVDLTPDQSSHVNLEGGGDLSFQYTPQGDMLLNGRYTLTGGTFKYALPVIPLKEFTIQEGSYVQWNGPVMNPVLNLTATERVRASVNSDGSARSVNFDVGVELKDRLETPALQFVLNAPEDRAMEDELNAKGTEERAKLAVSMLVTGMYLGSSSNGKVNMNMGTALNNFLQNEINNIAGSALKSVDLSFGMDSYDENGSEGGGSRTDYSFRFAKRFYNDRIRVILGGRISTGDNINNGQAQPFIDNVSVEYRLDDSGSRYVKLFHNKNYESLLEGEITETGAGVVLRRKMRYLRELFNFKKKTAAVVNRSVEEEVNDEVVE
ncbi:MAG: translocation/assembly module TamB domain-containing protein, partial [Parabacteroides sp.]